MSTVIDRVEVERMLREGAQLVADPRGSRCGWSFAPCGVSIFHRHLVACESADLCGAKTCGVPKPHLRRIEFGADGKRMMGR